MKNAFRLAEKNGGWLSMSGRFAATLAVSPTRAAELLAEAPALAGTDDATAPTQPMHRHEHEEHGKTPAGVFGDL